MSAYTVTGSLTHFRKGSLDLFSAKPEHYAFSNIFDVAQRSDFFERVAVTKNIEYVTEVIKIQHDSPWFIAAHDEFALIMMVMSRSLFLLFPLRRCRRRRRKALIY
ncbi:hypothetical protein [Pseudomonas lactucae]|uniref:hypothetical protein n=1 Tax=Pseudomonas lactucae TaxID=2813360 RepID=UPI0019677DD4|nr:hypothetical protein [Pseudomonas lactucae]MBN2988237.1 hypothetical protein [Pseudomonas lactucae]